ncbi:acyl-CoA dehydrogenase family protein, partial [Streptomyces sp. NPDC005921]
MNFELSEEQEMLRTAARDLLSDRAPITHVRAWADRAEDVDPEVWRLTADLGWPGLGLPEEYGGAGQGLVELALVAEEMGRALGRGPVTPSRRSYGGGERLLRFGRGDVQGHRGDLS